MEYLSKKVLQSKNPSHQGKMHISVTEEVNQNNVLLNSEQSLRHQQISQQQKFSVPKKSSHWRMQGDKCLWQAYRQLLQQFANVPSRWLCPLSSHVIQSVSLS